MEGPSTENAAPAADKLEEHRRNMSKTITKKSKDRRKNRERIREHYANHTEQLYSYKEISQKAPTSREETNCEKLNNRDNVTKSVPAGSGELTPDKLIKKGVRLSKSSGPYDGGTVVESGTSNPSLMSGFQYLEHREKAAEYRKRYRERERRRKLEEQKARLERIERERNKVKGYGRGSIIEFLDSLTEEERGEWIKILFPGLDESADLEEWYRRYKMGSIQMRKSTDELREEKLRWQREYYREHRAEILEKKRQYDHANREKIRERKRAYFREYYHRNKGKFREYYQKYKKKYREYYQKNREKLMEYAREHGPKKRKIQDGESI